MRYKPRCTTPLALTDGCPTQERFLPCSQVTIISIAISNIWKLYKAPHNISVVGPVPSGLPGYTGGHFFPLVGSTGKTVGLAVLVRGPPA